MSTKSPLSSRYNKQTISWMMYDFANSIFAVIVLSSFFPIFFKKYAASGMEVTQSTYYLGISNTIAGGLILLFLPLLGYIADRFSAKKALLIFFVILGVGFTYGLRLFQEGQWVHGMVVYILASFGFYGANVFYDSYLVDICDKKDCDWISSLGYTLGYLGGGLGFAVMILIFMKKEVFGFADDVAVTRFAFLAVCVWWILFSVPLFLWVKQAKRTVNNTTLSVLRRIIRFFKDARHNPLQRNILLFLIAYLFYIDGVNTVIKMAVDYGLSIGLKSTDLLLALLLTQFVAIPFTLLFGMLAERVGAKVGIYVAVVGYMGIVIWASFLDHAWEFYMLAVFVAFIQGGVQALSRSYYMRLIPKEKSAFYFGIYNFIGKFSTLLGPLIIGVVALKYGSRMSILSLLPFFVIGLGLLRWVKQPPSVTS